MHRLNSRPESVGQISVCLGACVPDQWSHYYRMSAKVFVTPAGGALWLSLRRSVLGGDDECCHAARCCSCSVSCAAQGILALAGMDQNCAHAAIQECTGKMQFAVSAACTVQLQPDLPVAADGTFCSPSRGVQQRGERLVQPAQAAAAVLGSDAVVREGTSSGCLLRSDSWRTRATATTDPWLSAPWGVHTQKVA